MHLHHLRPALLHCSPCCCYCALCCRSCCQCIYSLGLLPQHLPEPVRCCQRICTIAASSCASDTASADAPVSATCLDSTLISAAGHMLQLHSTCLHVTATGNHSYSFIIQRTSPSESQLLKMLLRLHSTSLLCHCSCISQLQLHSLDLVAPPQIHCHWKS